MARAFSARSAGQQSARRDKEFSLAAACFDFPCADDCASPAQHAPDSWRAELLQKADAAVWSGLFTACRTGRDLVLSTASHATLTLDFTAQQPSSVWQQLSMARHCLSVRGALSTSLTVMWAPGAPSSAVAFSAIPAAISGVSVGIVSITVRNEDARPDYTNAQAEALLQALCAACPNLRSLDVSAFPYPLPPPSALPQLTELTVEPSTRNRDSIIAVMTQLRKVQLVGFEVLDVFLRSPPAPHLTHLSICVELTDNLCNAIVHAPALTHISCEGLSLSEFIDDREWGVRSITVNYPSIGDVINLPINHNGKVDIVSPNMSLSVYDTEGLPEDVLARLGECRFITARVELSPSDFFEPSHHPTALRNTLRQLSALDAPDSRIELKGWDWMVQGMAQAVLDILPTLPHHKFGMYISKMTEDLLSVLFHPDLVWQQADQHANTAWPWEELVCWSVTLPSVLGLPRAHGQVPCRVRTYDVYINTHITEEALRDLREKLQHITWAQVQHSDVKFDHLLISLDCPGGDAAQLPVQVAALQAMRLHPSVIMGSWAHVDTGGVTVRLKEWQLNAAAVQALRGLPEWDAALDMLGCTLAYPANELSAYAQLLAQCIPTSYTTWALSEQHDSAFVSALCDALNTRRAGLGLPPVRVELRGYEGDDIAVGEHVILCRWEEPYWYPEPC